MEKFLHRAVRFAGLCAMLALGACGGGGGGGSTGSNGSSGPTVSLLSAATLTDLTYAGLPAHPTGFQLGVSGDLGNLSSKSLFIKVVQPEDLFVQSFTFVSSADQSLSISLLGNANHPLTAGHTTGVLQVHACLDAGCTAELQNSPLSIGYDLEARPGLQLSTNLIDETVNVGDTAPAQTISVTLPAGAVGWGYTATDTPAGAVASSSNVVSPWLRADTAAKTLVFTPTMAPPNAFGFVYQAGLYAQDYQVTAFVPDLKAPTQNVQLKQTLSVRHRIVATGPYLVTPSSAEVRTVSLSALDPGIPVPLLMSQVAGGSFSRVGVRMDTFPPAAAGNPLLAQWLQPFNDFINPLAHTEHFCDPTAFPKKCLPPGTYTGAVLARQTMPDGTITNIEYPVTVTLVP